jgi:predicted kinase
MKLYLLCGLAFAGKSTLAASIADQTGAVVVSLDAINAERGLAGGLGIPDGEWARSHEIARARVESALASGRSVVVDDTNCFRSLRDGYRAVGESLGADCIVVRIDAEPSLVLSRLRENDRALARPRVTEEVLRDLIRKFEPPGADECQIAFPASSDPGAWVVANLAPRLGG